MFDSVKNILANNTENIQILKNKKKLTMKYSLRLNWQMKSINMAESETNKIAIHCQCETDTKHHFGVNSHFQLLSGRWFVEINKNKNVHAFWAFQVALLWTYKNYSNIQNMESKQILPVE